MLHHPFLLLLHPPIPLIVIHLNFYGLMMHQKIICNFWNSFLLVFMKQILDIYLFVDFYIPTIVWILMLCWTKWWFWSSPYLNSFTIVANYDDAFLVIDGDYPTIEFCFNVQCLEVDEIELENVIKRGRKVNKHVDVWAKNAFDEWRKFWRYDIQIYNGFVWKCKDHQGTWWYIGFVCVTSCKKKMVLFTLQPSKNIYILLLYIVVLSSYFLFNYFFVVSSCNFQFSYYVFLLLFVFLIVFCCMEAFNHSLEVLISWSSKGKINELLKLV
jgi:hypothetical protein